MRLSYLGIKERQGSLRWFAVFTTTSPSGNHLATDEQVGEERDALVFDAAGNLATLTKIVKGDGGNRM
jgi:hypothetical protein